MNQKGNALFLILIAVALFAALSYAVMQSGGGGGTIDKETNLLTASRITQYGSSLKVAVMRMVLTGTAVNSLEFYSGASPCSTGVDCVYSPEGGDFSYKEVPVVGGNWDTYYSGSAGAISGVGTTANDVFILGWGIPKPVCEAINKGLYLSITPIAFDLDGNTLLIDAYPGKTEACAEFMSNAGFYYYYHVLVAQ